MRRLFTAFVFLAVVSASSITCAYTSPGAPTGYINDFAQALSADTKQTLETELSAFEARTSNEITVAIVPDMDGDYIENYAVKLFEEWGVGKADRDNGVLLVLAMEERSMRIEVGYGLEGALPDSLAQRILDDEMRPLLRDANIDAAITAGVRAIQDATKGEYTPKQSPSMPQGLSWLANNFYWVFFVIITVFQWIAAMLARSKSWWAGGILGALAGIGLGWFITLSFGVTVFIAALFGFFGLVLDYIVSSTYRSYSGRGSTPPWWTGGGGFGGRSGGGFGGFGGGSSGGGGASSRW